MDIHPTSDWDSYTALQGLEWLAVRAMSIAVSFRLHQRLAGLAKGYLRASLVSPVLQVSWRRRWFSCHPSQFSLLWL
jgi:hypothetical protein